MLLEKRPEYTLTQYAPFGCTKNGQIPGSRKIHMPETNCTLVYCANSWWTEITYGISSFAEF